MDEIADISAKVPVELKARLKAYAKKEWESESSIIRKALDSYLPTITNKIVKAK